MISSKLNYHLSWQKFILLLLCLVTSILFLWMVPFQIQLKLFKRHGPLCLQTNRLKYISNIKEIGHVLLCDVISSFCGDRFEWTLPSKWKVWVVREGWVFCSYLSFYGGHPLFYNFLSQSVDRDFQKANIKKVEACNSVTSSSLLNLCYSLILWWVLVHNKLLVTYYFYFWVPIPLKNGKESWISGTISESTNSSKVYNRTLGRTNKRKNKKQCTWVAWTNNQVIYVRCEKHGKWKTASWEIALGKQDGLRRKKFLGWCCKSSFDKKGISTVILTYCQAPPVLSFIEMW